MGGVGGGRNAGMEAEGRGATAPENISSPRSGNRVDGGADDGSEEPQKVSAHMSTQFGRGDFFDEDEMKDNGEDVGENDAKG